MRCEAYWTTCGKRSTKLAVFPAVGNGDLTTLHFCGLHAAQFADETFRRKLIDGALDTLGVLRDSGLARRPMRDLLKHPAHIALVAHQASCDRCREVRTWLIQEQGAGKIQASEDIERIGRYVIDHACEEGIELNRQVGLAMQGQ